MRKDTGIIKSSVQKMKMRGVMKSMNAWRGFVMRKILIRNMMHKVMQRVQSMTLSCTFKSWAVAAHRLKCLRIIGDKAVLRLMNRRMTRSFVQWSASVAHDVDVRHRLEDADKFRSQMQRSEEQMHKCILASAYQTRKLRCYAKVMKAWLGRSQRAVTTRQKAARVVQRIRLLSMAAAFAALTR